MSDNLAMSRHNNSIILALFIGLLTSMLSAFSPAFGIFSAYLLGGGEYPLMIMLIAYLVNSTLAMSLPSCFVLRDRSRARVGRLIMTDFFAILSAIPLSLLVFPVVGAALSVFRVSFEDTTWTIFIFTASYYITAWFLHGRAMRFLEAPAVNGRREWMTMASAVVASILSAIIYAADMWIDPPEPNQFFGPFPSVLVFGLAVFLHVWLPGTTFVLHSREEPDRRPPDTSQTSDQGPFSNPQPEETAVE
ncbi:hypothetical protein [Lacunimicrobium album]